MASLDKARVTSSVNTLRAAARAPRTRRFVLGVLIFLVVFGLLGFFAAPPLIRNLAEKQLSAQLDRPVTIGRVALNPYTLNFEADRVHIGEHGAPGSFFDVERLVVRTSWSSVLHLAPIVNEVRLDSPRIWIVRYDAQRFNFSDLIDKFSKPSPQPSNGKPTPFSVSNIRIENGQIHFDDRLLHEQHVIDRWSLGIPFIATLPSKTDVFVQPQLRARLDGTSTIALDGKTKPFTASLESDVQLRTTALDVPRLLTYAPAKLPVDVRAGKLSTDLQLGFVMSGDTPVLRVSGTADLDGVDIAGPDGAPFVGVRAFHMNAASLEPLRGVYHFDEIRIDGPTVNVARARDGTLSVQRMLAAQPAAPAPAVAAASAAASAPPAAKASAQAQAVPLDLAIRHFALTGGTVNLHDETPAKPVDLSLTGMAATLDGLSTTAKTDARYTFNTGLSTGGTLAVTGAFGLAGRHADAKIDLQALALAPLQPFVAGATEAQIGDGRLGVQANVSTSWASEPAAVQVGQSTVSVDTLKVLLPGAKTPAIALAQAQVQIDKVDLAARDAQVASVDVTGLHVAAGKLKNGDIDLMRLARTPAAAHPVREAAPRRAEVHAAAKQAPAPAWHYRIGALNVKDSEIDVTDSTTSPRPVKLTIAPLQLQVQQFSDDLSKPLPVLLKATLNRKGTLSVDGHLTPMPLKGVLRLDANRLDAAAFEPYFGNALNATVASALLSLRGQLTVEQRKALTVDYRGNTALTDVRMIDKTTSDPFAGWRSLALTNLKASYGPDGTDVDAARVTFSGFYGRVLLDQQGKLNLSDVVAKQDGSTVSLTQDNSGKTPVPLTPQPASAVAASAVPALAAPRAAGAPATAEAAGPASATVAPASPPMRLHFGELVLQNGRVNYTDHFVTPNYSADLVDIQGKVGAFGTDSTTPAPVDVTAKLAANGPLTIKGSVNPLIAKPSLDLAVSAHEIELTNLTPYSAKYAGYPITKGKLNVDLNYKLANDQLSANNHIFIDQLTFGDHVDNNTETKLPVKLAISLLKNSRGEIDLNIPVSGSLSNPQFSIGSVIWHAVLNLIAKAVTAPFSLLAHALGGGNSEELGYVEFTAGSAQLSDADKKKLDTIAKVLADKTDLKIDLIGRVDPAVDTPALRTAYVDNLVRQQKVKDTVGNGESVDPADVKVDDSEYARYLEKAYKSADFKKPRNMVGLTKTLPAGDMKQALADHAPVNDASLRELAQQRAQAVQQYFQDGNKVDGKRVFVVAPKLDAKGIEDKGATTRVDFGLKQ